LQLYRIRLDKQISDAIKREEDREKRRGEMLAGEAVGWKREGMERAFRKERAQAKTEIEGLQYDNELSLAHKLARMGLLK